MTTAATSTTTSYLCAQASQWGALSFYLATAPTVIGEYHYAHWTQSDIGSTGPTDSGYRSFGDTQLLVPFPNDPMTITIAEEYQDGSWFLALAVDQAIFAEGDSLEQAKRNLVASAREDHRILSDYGDRLTGELKRRRALLRYLLG